MTDCIALSQVSYTGLALVVFEPVTLWSIFYRVYFVVNALGVIDSANTPEKR